MLRRILSQTQRPISGLAEPRASRYNAIVSDPQPSEEALARIALLLEENQKLLKQNAELLFRVSRQLEAHLSGSTQPTERRPSDDDREFMMGL